MTIAKILMVCAVGVWPAAGAFAYVPGKPVHVITRFSLPAMTTEESVPESNTSELVAQTLCRTFIGEYVSHDHAIRVQNDLRRNGLRAWIEYHGCLTCNPSTRTYVVFAMLPCR